MHRCIRNLGGAFTEFEEVNKSNLLKLTTSGIYTPRLIDSVEYYSRWIEEQDDIQPF